MTSKIRENCVKRKKMKKKTQYIEHILAAAYAPHPMCQKSPKSNKYENRFKRQNRITNWNNRRHNNDKRLFVNEYTRI